MSRAAWLALAFLAWAAEPPSPEKGPPPVVVVKTALCTAINDREPLDPRTPPVEFESRMRWIYFWNVLEVERPPRTIKHVWSLAGKPVYTAKLPVKQARARTWSSKGSLAKGAWTVSVVDEDGKVLATSAFKVR